MNAALRLVKSFSGPPEPRSRYDGPGPDRADPPGVRLRGDRVAQVLEAVEDVHRTVFDAIFVPGDQAASNAAVVRILLFLVEEG